MTVSARGRAARPARAPDRQHGSQLSAHKSHPNEVRGRKFQRQSLCLLGKPSHQSLDLLTRVLKSSFAVLQALLFSIPHRCCGEQSGISCHVPAGNSSFSFFPPSDNYLCE